MAYFDQLIDLLDNQDHNPLRPLGEPLKPTAINNLKYLDLNSRKYIKISLNFPHIIFGI